MAFDASILEKVLLDYLEKHPEVLEKLVEAILNKILNDITNKLSKKDPQ